MPDGESTDEVKAKEERWPFLLLFLFMLGEIFGMTTNTDLAKLDYSISVVLGMIAAAGAEQFRNIYNGSSIKFWSDTR